MSEEEEDFGESSTVRQPPKKNEETKSTGSNIIPLDEDSTERNNERP
jgi:hypothetical protein